MRDPPLLEQISVAYAEEIERLRMENEKLQKLVGELRDAVIWMSGCADFGPGGVAHEGWVKIRHLALSEIQPAKFVDEDKI